MDFLGFKDIKVQKKFNDWQEPSRLKQISGITFLTATLYLLMSVIDRFIAPQQILSLMVFIHLFAIPCILLVISILAYLKKFSSFITALLFIAPILAAIGNIVIVSNFDGYSIYSNEIYLIIFWTLTVSGLKLTHAIYSALIIIIISTISAYTVHQLQTTEFIMHIYWLLSSFLLAFIGAYFLEDSNRTTFLKYEELALELSNKDILSKELFHRVKNNLQVVSGLLSLQSKRVKDEDAKNIFKETTQRIKSIALIHEKLYQSNNLEIIDFKDYTISLIDDIKETFKGNDIEFNVVCDSIKITLEKAVPIGLIINEILTNSVKYAFDSDMQNKTINVKMYQDNKDSFILEVCDNGKGIDIENLEQGFGFILIQTLAVHQLKGTVEYFNKNGLCYVSKFNKDILA